MTKLPRSMRPRVRATETRLRAKKCNLSGDAGSETCVEVHHWQGAFNVKH